MPIDRLRATKASRGLLADWEEAVMELDLRQRVLPRLQNTDGDELLFTVDHFDMALGAAPVIENRLAALDGAEPTEPDEQPRTYTFVRRGTPEHRHLKDTVIGRVVVAGTRLRLESNSVARADALRERVETACSGLLTHRAREHADPIAQLDQVDEAGPGVAPRELPSSPFVDQALLDVKRRHYATWADQPMPALDDKTPRETVRSSAGRARVELLVREMENHEAREAEARRFDFGPLRRELGLAES